MSLFATAVLGLILLGGAAWVAFPTMRGQLSLVYLLLTLLAMTSGFVGRPLVSGICLALGGAVFWGAWRKRPQEA